MKPTPGFENCLINRAGKVGNIFGRIIYAMYSSTQV